MATKVLDLTCEKCGRRCFAEGPSFCCLAPTLLVLRPEPVAPHPVVRPPVKVSRDPRASKCDQCSGPAHTPGALGGVTLCRACFDSNLATPSPRPFFAQSDIAMAAMFKLHRRHGRRRDAGVS